MSNLYIRYPSNPGSVTPPIPAGAATSANQLTEIGYLTTIASNTAQLATAQPVSQSGSWTVSLAAGSVDIGKVDQGNAGTLAQSWYTNLSQVGGTSFALGQQLAAASLPVVLTASQLSTLTPLSTVTVTQGTAANLNATVTGTVAATQSGTWNITNVSGTVSLPTGASTSANQTNGTQKTQIVDGSNNVISSTSNALNVNVSSGTVTATNSANGNTGSTVPTQATYIGGNYAGNLIGLKLDSAGELLVQQADSTATGTITSNQSVSIALNGAGTVGIQISGTWTGSITAEGSVDGTNYSALPCAALTSGGIGSVFTVNNIFQASVAGLGFMRMRGTTVATGTATINLISNHAVGALSLLNSLPSGTNTIGSISNISGTVSLPTGAATSANQVTGNSTLSTISGQLPAALGAQVTSASLAVNIASDQTVNVINPDTTATGSITTQNLVPGGTATTGSAVAINLSNKGTVTIQVTGTYSGALSPQVTTDGTNWITQASGVLQNMATGGVSATIPSGSVGIWQIEINGHAQFRITALAAVTGTAVITLRAASGTSQVSATINSSALPTGAATSANQTTLGSQTTKINDGTNTAAVKAASTAASATDPALVVAISPNNTVAATQSGTWNITNISGTVSLPTGAATSANQTTLGSQTSKINDGTNTATVKAASTAAATTDTALVVAVSPNNTINVAAPKGRAQANAPVVTSYSSTNVTSAAYVQLVASTTSAANMIEIFDSSGVALYFATGSAGSEVNQFVIYPGGNGPVNFAIAASTRLSVKAVSTSATSGTGIINLYT